MKTSATLAILCAALVFSFACAKTRSNPPLGTAPCRIGTLQAECRTVEVYENRETRTGRKLALKVVVIRSHSQHPQPDPLFGIAGGPGIGITAGAEFGAQQFDWARRDRDLVLVDSRGTGESNPLNCAVPSGSLQQRFEPLVATARRCLPELSARADLTQYHTENIADDLDDVRAALGYDRINIQGTSYGTRVAQVYARRHGEHLRSMLLEGVYPVSEHLPLGISRNSQRVLDAILDLCAANNDCAQHYPHLHDDLARVTRRLEQGPVTVTVTNPSNGKLEQVQLDHAMAAQGIRFLLYEVEGANRVPKLIHAAAAGDWRPLAEVALQHTINGSDGFAFGMWLSVTCTEDVQQIRDEQVTPDSDGTFFGPFRVQAQRAACAIWPKGKLSPEFSTPVRSDVPALLAVGALDPQTPPPFAREVAAAMPNARVLEMPGYGHALFGMIGDGCLDLAEQQLLQQGTAASLDVSSCLAALRRPPFEY